MSTKPETPRTDLLGPLASIPLFSGLPVAAQEALLASMREETVATHQTVCWYGDRAEGLFLIQSGEVSVSVPNDNGEHVVINQLGPGDFFGEIGLLDGGPRTATVRAVSHARLLKLDRKAFHAFLAAHPASAIEMLTVMGRRHREVSDTIKGMKNPNVVFAETHAGAWQKACDIIARVAASSAFVLSHVVFFAGWILWNSVMPGRLAFDPYPFGLLTVMVSLEAIFLSIFVMVSQSRQSEKDRLRTDLDYQVNLKAQTEIMAISRQLERIEVRLAQAESSGGESGTNGG